MTTSGWPAVRKRCAELGVTFRPWQTAVGRLILSKRATGRYAAEVGGVGLAIPRQVGKTFLIGAIVFALCLLHPKLTVIWTAHRGKTAEETFRKMQAFARRKRIAPHVERVVLGSGEEAVMFRNGSRVLFGARGLGFGLGFDEVDILVLDEAQRVTDKALDDMIPATNQSRFPAGALVLMMGTPPRPSDVGDAFVRMRTDALSGEDTETVWVEFGADEDYEPTRAPAPLSDEDWRQIAKANPSFPADTPREAILRMRKLLDHESFRREGMGIWDKQHTHATTLPGFPDLVSHDPPGEAEPPAALAVDMSHGRELVVVACWPGDDEPHVEVVRRGRSEVAAVEWLATVAGRRIPVVVDSYSPAASMVPALKGRRVRVTVTGAPDMAKACGLLFAASNDGRLSHIGQTELVDAAEAAVRRNIGQAGGWGWDRRDPGQNIAPLVAATLALLGALTNRRAAANRRTRQDRRAVFR